MDPVVAISRQSDPSISQRNQVLASTLGFQSQLFAYRRGNYINTMFLIVATEYTPEIHFDVLYSLSTLAVCLTP